MTDWESGASAVTWNDTLASYASKAAGTYAYGHTHGPCGENIAAGVEGGYGITNGYDNWADEASKYEWHSPGFSAATGHFTQVSLPDPYISVSRRMSADCGRNVVRLEGD
jgi:outer membrane cobalamin receptor